MREAAAAILLLTASAVVWAELDESSFLPIDNPAIGYADPATHNPVARLDAKLGTGEVTLQYEPDHGYLRSVLDALNVRVSSQTLVFTKTSFQAPRIAPRTPRAIYHTDTTAVGWVKGGDVVEVATVDAQLGVVFYTLDQGRTSHPRFARRGSECLQCHLTTATLGVPGLLVRSVVPDRSGMALFPGPSYVTDHRTPFLLRYGGWYVTGIHGAMRHMGNVYVERGEGPEALDTQAGANVTDLKRDFDTGAYLAPGSDLVSLLVLEHQTRATNLITRIHYLSKLGKPVDDMVDQLAQYLLFLDEAPITSPVKGTSAFADEYQAQGPRDRKGRSLYQLDLRTRLLKYPCSPLIYSEAFDALPQPVLDKIYQRLWEDLSKMKGEDRRAVIEILLDTKPGLPDSWRPSS